MGDLNDYTNKIYQNPGENPFIFISDIKTDPRGLPEQEYSMTLFEHQEIFEFCKCNPRPPQQTP